MTEAVFFDWLVIGWLGIAAAVFVTLFFVTAPYGRHAREGWGPKVPFLWGWILMELPAPAGMLAWFAVADHPQPVVAWIFLGLWELHYVQRTFVYAWIRRDRGRAMPISIVSMGFIFNLGNSYLMGRWLFTLGPSYPDAWLTDPRFLIGVAIFLVGWALNIQSDTILLRLRKPGETGYRIPKGGLYRFVSCPNYFSELVEWFGWALATWSVPALAFALWTAANLAPRARSNHLWYRKTFSDYPAERRALVPYLW